MKVFQVEQKQSPERHEEWDKGSMSHWLLILDNSDQRDTGRKQEYVKMAQASFSGKHRARFYISD